jgi:uncharacterized protein (DUF2062 family)
MPRHLIKRYMPDPNTIREHKSLRFFGSLLHDPNLWHLNRHSVARAMGMGLFAALMPIPLQMLLAAVLVIWVRGNLPMPPVFYCTYKIGALLMGLPPRHFPDEMSWDWISGQLTTLWQPFLLGSIVAGVVLGVMGYFLTMGYWRWWVARQWRLRKEKRRR